MTHAATRELLPLPVGRGEDALLAMPHLASALDGTGPALALVDAASGQPAETARVVARRVPDEVALVIQTSGSTGAPTLVALSRSALRASAVATRAWLETQGLLRPEPAQWLLALPAHHVAGAQVLLRSLADGTTPVAVDPGASAVDLAAATASLNPGRQHVVSLVPTQLDTLLGDPAGTAALASYDVVLVGGAASHRKLLDRARRAGVRVVTTYGATETCGGCVYDGRPLPGVDVSVDSGRVEISGPVLALGVLQPDGSIRDLAAMRDGRRWWPLSDSGTITDGVLHVTGRVDDLITTGGEKVSPTMVESALLAIPWVDDALVTGVPDPHWGQAVAALVVLASNAPRLADPRTAVREALRPHLPTAAVPQRVVTVGVIPRHGIGKPDRAAAAALLTAQMPSD